jgi:predicted metalloendopeptidase
MSAIVLDVQQTAPDTWHSYLAWVLTRQYTHNLDSRFEEARLDYVKAVYGITEETPRWKRCLSSVKVRAALQPPMY